MLRSESGKPRLRSGSGTVRQRSECPGTGQKRNSQEQAVKRIEQRALKKRNHRNSGEADFSHVGILVSFSINGFVASRKTEFS